MTKMFGVYVWTSDYDRRWLEAIFQSQSKAEIHARGFRSLTSDAYVRPLDVSYNERP